MQDTDQAFVKHEKRAVVVVDDRRDTLNLQQRNIPLHTRCCDPDHFILQEMEADVYQIQYNNQYVTISLTFQVPNLIGSETSQ